MKREVVRWEGVRVVQDGIKILDGFRLRLYEGEVHGLVTLSERESLALTAVFSGAVVPSRGEQFVCEAPRDSFRGPQPENRVFQVVHRGAPLVPNLPVADNVVLFDSPHHLASMINDRDVRLRATVALEQLGCSRLIGQATADLTLWERIQVHAGRALV